MATFPGGSAWAMAKDVAEGFLLVTERTFTRFDRAQLDQLAFEMDRALREIRAEAVPLDDLAAIKVKNRKLTRLTGALSMLKGFVQRRFRHGDRPSFDGNA
jgi:hypothetical protein